MKRFTTAHSVQDTLLKNPKRTAEKTDRTLLLISEKGTGVHVRPEHMDDSNSGSHPAFFVLAAILLIEAFTTVYR